MTTPQIRKMRSARARVKWAIKTGRLVRPETCSRCGCDCKPDGHHADYDKPLYVEWLCRRCHIRSAHPAHINRFVVSGQRRYSVAKRAEILRHHAKGRSLADIVLWTNIPVSVVQKVIAQAA